jgi:large subunit ribosomal protein L32
MAVPKKKRSKSKKRTRKACWKIEMPNLRPCPNCGALTASHHVCSGCGFYKGRQVVQLKVKKAKQKEA